MYFDYTIIIVWKNGREIDFIFNGKTAFEAKETPVENDHCDLEYLSGVAGIKNFKLIGKNISPKFTDYIWAGSIQ